MDKPVLSAIKNVVSSRFQYNAVDEQAILTLKSRIYTLDMDLVTIRELVRVTGKNPLNGELDPTSFPDDLDLMLKVFKVMANQHSKPEDLEDSVLVKEFTPRGITAFMFAYMTFITAQVDSDIDHTISDVVPVGEGKGSQAPN